MSGKLLKWSLHLFNFVVLLTGVALITIGALFLSLFKHDINFAMFSVQNTAGAFLIIGGLLVLMAFFGFIAMRTTNSKLYIIHVTGLVLLFIALALVGISGLVITFNGYLLTTTRQEIKETIANYNESNSDSLDAKAINWLQQKFKCCGLDSYKDWESKHMKLQAISERVEKNLRIRNQTTFDVPDTCCVNIAEGCGKQFPELDTLNRAGCFEPFYNFLSNDMKILSGVACGLALLTLIAIAVLVFVAFSVKGNYSKLSMY
jgi:tetraspanin-33